MTIIERLPEIVYPLTQVNKVNEIVDVLNQTSNSSYTEENPALTPVEGTCEWTVTHNLGTENVSYNIYQNDTSVLVPVEVTSEDTIVISINSSSGITANTYKVVVFAKGAASGSSGGGGSSDHSQLTNLDYAHSGHTGFMSGENFIPSGTIFSIESDGSGDFTTLSSAVASLANKWSNGEVIFQIGDTTIDEGMNPVTLGGTSSTYNIPLITIKGTTANSTLQWDYPAQGGDYDEDRKTLIIDNTKVKIKDLTIQNLNYHWNYVAGWGIYITNQGVASIDNCIIQNLADAIHCTQGSYLFLQGNNRILNTKKSGLRASEAANIRCNFPARLGFNATVTAILVAGGSILQLPANTIAFEDNVTTKCNITPNTLTPEGILFCTDFS